MTEPEVTPEPVEPVEHVAAHSADVDVDAQYDAPDAGLHGNADY